jgi:hypothetical protein
MLKQTTLDLFMGLSNFHLSTKAWLFCYHNVLQNNLLCKLISAKMIDFSNLVQDINHESFRALSKWNPNPAHLDSIKDKGTFFALVEKWAEVVLCNKCWKLERFGGDKGLGLSAREQMYDSYICFSF